MTSGAGSCPVSATGRSAGAPDRQRRGRMDAGIAHAARPRRSCRLSARTCVCGSIPGGLHIVSDEEIGEARALCWITGYRGRTMKQTLSGLWRIFVAADLIAILPLRAQADFSGVWQPRYHEDQPERIPGPELRDYARAADQRDRASVRRQLGSRRASRCRKSSAACTSRRTSIAGRRICGSGKRSDPKTQRR